MAYLLDTNAVIALMKNHSRVVERIRHIKELMGTELMGTDLFILNAVKLAV